MSDELSKMSREELCSKARAVAAYQRDWKSTGKYYPDYANLTDELTRRLAAVEADRDHWKARAVAAEGVVWTPITEHPKDWLDGNSYLLRIPVADKTGRTYSQFHIVTVVADEDTFYFNDASGEYWGAWSWDDADYFIRLDRIPEPPARQPEHDAGGEVGK